MKRLWLKDNGEFEIRTCKGAEAYLLDKTGIQAQVHKTTSYLVINYVKSGALGTSKIDLPGGVLYCLHEKHFQPLIQAMTQTTI